MTAWLGDAYSPADFDITLAPRDVRRSADAGQEALFSTGTPTRAAKPAQAVKRLPGEVDLFSEDTD